MAFNSLPAVDPNTAQQHQAIQLSSERLGVSAQQLSCVKALVLWQEFLSPRFTAEDQQQRRDFENYLSTMGYLPESKQLRTHAQSKKTDVQDISSRLLHSIKTGHLTAEILAMTDPLVLKNDYPCLSKSQIMLLQKFTAQQQRLDGLEIEGLERQFPFPINQTNFFGRFLASGCETPQRAARFMQLSSPFLIRMRSLIEGLANDQKNLLHLDIFSQKMLGDHERGKRTMIPLPTAQIDSAIETIHAVINHSSDFLSGLKIASGRSLRCISVPTLPQISSDHIDESDKASLAVAIFGWLLHGERNHPLLSSRSLPSHEEARERKLRTQLESKKEQQKSHLKTHASLGSSSKELRLWERKDKNISSNISRIERQLSDIDSRRGRIEPILKQLEHDSNLMTGIRTFRSNIAKALANDKKIVFAFPQDDRPRFGTSILSFYDRAYNAKGLQRSPAVALLHSSAALLSDSARHIIHEHRVPGFRSLDDRHIRTFKIDSDEINQSVQYLAAGLLRRAENPTLTMLINRLFKELDIPGVSSAKDLRYLTKEASGRRSPTSADYLNYVFERISYMNQDQFLETLGVLRQMGITTLPPRCLELSAERFRHPSQIARQFAVFNENYRPAKIGSAPEIFSDLATFEKFLKIGLDAYGVAPEVQQLEHLILTHGIVAIVDGTNYHPELDVEIGAIGEKLDKNDSEKTTEVWGDYVRPLERVVRSFALRLMEGNVHPSLRDYSLMGIAKPDKVDQVFQKLIKKFYGLDIDITPDLSAINRVLADLTLYDEKTILVIDAKSVNDLEQYRQFLSLLEKYQIKIILRTREPLPGIPQVNIQPFLDHTIQTRLEIETSSLHRRLELNTPIEPSLVQFASTQVQRLRQPGADPLNLTLQVLHGAAAQARLHPDKQLSEQDIVAALPPIFHLPDGQQMRLRLDAIDSFIDRAPLQVLGQKQAIETIGRRMKSHILGMRDPTRPLTLLLPGPTGVGKTELMLHFARACDIPFFMIEGAEFSEEHSTARLVGSPSGYVGPDQGILYKFLSENNIGLVFIDEIEKMHPSVYQALMNFFDKATLTAGDGKTVTRPGFIIVGASNAGANKLTRDMSSRQVKDVLAESFTDRFGQPRPELVRRFEPVVMHAIEESAFRQMLDASLNAIGTRPGFINANLRLDSFDNAAAELLYKSAKEVCAYSEKGMKKTGQFGFTDGSATIQEGLYFDMRHVSRALDELAGDALQELATNQYSSNQHQRRNQALQVRLIGHKATGKIAVQIL